MVLFWIKVFLDPVLDGVLLRAVFTIPSNGRIQSSIKSPRLEGIGGFIQERLESPGLHFPVD